MRCLHCGKELAVFKRLARQEFCSEIHRRQYREKYDQLALGRLLEEKSSEESTQKAPRNGRGPITLRLGEPPLPAQSPPAPTPQAPEKGAPAGMAGILVDQLIPAAVETTAKVTAEIEMAPTLAPEQPQQRFETPPAVFRRAAEVRFLPAARIPSPAARTHERRLDVRGFGGAAPVVEIHVNGSTAAELEAADAALEVQITPQLPSNEPALWTAPEREFTSCRIEFGSLVELELPKIGFEAEQERAAPVVESVAFEPVALEPVALEPVALEPVALEPVALEPAAVEAVDLEAKTWNEPKPADRQPESIPERVTRPMPVTLHGVAAGKARPVQIFPALTSGTGVQTPRCEALPLRPVMILGPAVVRESKLPERETRRPELRLSAPMNSGLSRTVKVAAGVVA